MPRLPVPAPFRRTPKPGEQNGSGNGNGAGNGSTARERMKEVPADLVGWVDERTGATGFLTGMLYRKVPKGTNWFYTLGSATMFAFISQAVTGVVLAMYYDPDPNHAYDSVQHITND